MTQLLQVERERLDRFEGLKERLEEAKRELDISSPVQPRVTAEVHEDYDL